MSDLRPEGIDIELGGEKRNFLFTLNVMDDLQDEFDEEFDAVIGRLESKRELPKVLKRIVAALINDDCERKGKETKVTAREVGMMIAEQNLLAVQIAVLKAYGVSLPEPDEDDFPNQESGQQE